MTSGGHPSPTTTSVRSILERDGADVAGMLRLVDERTPGGPRARPVDQDTWSETLGRVGRHVAGFLELDTVEVMVAGWCSYQKLLDAARRTRDTDAGVPVDLAGTTLKLRRHPWIEITWQGRSVAELHFVVGVDVHVVTLGSTVRRGALVELTSGRADVTAFLSTLGEKIQGKATFDPERVVTLGNGIRLVD